MKNMVEEIKHYVKENKIVQTYKDAKAKIGEFKCRCGAKAADNAKVTFDIFSTVEKWTPRTIIDEADGSFFLQDESLDTIYLCRANIQCETCKQSSAICSTLDYEDQMEVIIAELAKQDFLLNMSCRPNVGGRFLLVTYFEFHNPFIDGVEEYYQDCDQEYEHNCDDCDDDEEDEDEPGWKKAWYKYNEKQ